MNDYIKQFVDAIKSAKDDNEIAVIVNKIYEEGFEDGVNSESEN